VKHPAVRLSSDFTAASLESLLAIAREVQVSAEFPAECLAEATSAAGNDLSNTEDFRELPFVTIDGATSKDLDQALFVEKRPNGDYCVHYALADAAFFVPKGSALFRHALLRGASLYLPGLAFPMLPHELSEGKCSLNANVDRRALCFQMEIAPDGSCTQTKVIRGAIRSRRKCTFDEVQEYYDGKTVQGVSGTDFEPSLRALKDVGLLLMAEAERRGVPRYRRAESELSWKNGALAMVRAPRLDVERYNEQLSLLCNREGARILLEAKELSVDPIFRVHAAPESERMEQFRNLVTNLLKAHGLLETIGAPPEGAAALATYLEKLPKTGPLARLAYAIHRHAILVNSRSSFSATAGGHYGVGAEAYARFSAPMRELVGVFVHHEMIDWLTKSGGADVELRAEVVEAANRSKDTQRQANSLVTALFFEAFFAPDVAVGGTPRSHMGTVMGITQNKVHVELDDPQLDIKVYFKDLGATHGWLWASPDETSLLRSDVRPATSAEGASPDASGQVLVRVGDAVALQVKGYDAERKRWHFTFTKA
jgi:ribonuclease R